MAHKLEEEVNAHPDLSFGLERPSEMHVYRVLHCDNCGNDTAFEITLGDSNQWLIECLACNEAATTFADLMSKLK